MRSEDDGDAVSVASCNPDADDCVTEDGSPSSHDAELVSQFGSLLTSKANPGDASSSDLSLIERLVLAPKTVCLLGDLSCENIPPCLKLLDLPVVENLLVEGKLPPDSSGVLLFVTSEWESCAVSYLGDLMIEQSNAIQGGNCTKLLEHPGVVRLVSLGVIASLAETSSRDEILKEVMSFKRPVMSLALLRARFAFTGFTSKDYVRYLTKLVHRMGGSVMQDTDSTTTHLVAKKACGMKYAYCKIYNVPVMKKAWIEDLWEAGKMGNEKSVEVEQYICPLFHELRVGFCGFSQDKLAEIKACLEKNGGKMVRHDADRVDFLGKYFSFYGVQHSLSAVFVNEATMMDGALPHGMNPKAVLVTESWFWESMLRGTVLMDEYRFKPLRPDMSCKSPSVESNRSSDAGNVTIGSLTGERVSKVRRRSFLNLKGEKRKKDDSLGRSPRMEISSDADGSSGNHDDGKSKDGDGGMMIDVFPPGKRSIMNGDQSVASVGDIDLTSESLGSLDQSGMMHGLDGPTTSQSALPRAPTARRQVFCELIQTERNYVMVLDLIMKAGTDWKQQQRDPRQSSAKKPGLASFVSHHNTSTDSVGLLNASQASVRHGASSPPPNASVTLEVIQDISRLSPAPPHRASDAMPETPGEQTFDSRILDKLLANVIPLQKIHGRLLIALQRLDVTWDENARVGAAIVEELGRDDVIRAYKAYIKDVDVQKSQLRGLADKYPRFHAYLRAIALKPEYKRQSLDELLIRPVQRLPSMMLLLKDLRKRTPAGLSDHTELNKALEIVDMTTSRINEERRIFDQQKEILLKMYEIQDCPPDLLSWSAGRSLIADYDVVDLNCSTSAKRGAPLVLFFFTDVLLICKRRVGRTGAGGMIRSSPSVASLQGDSDASHLQHHAGQRPYKFLCCLELRYVKALVDLRYAGRDVDLSAIVQDGSFGLCIQRDGELGQTNYAFHVLRAGASSLGAAASLPSSSSCSMSAPSSAAASAMSSPCGGGGKKENGGLAASASLCGSTLSLSEIAVKADGSPKQDLLRLLTDNVVRQTFQDPVAGVEFMIVRNEITEGTECDIWVGRTW
ncbi:unnamed protein product [Notodromas monacha]|uniref:Protein ECT2 n=1 Tax=Notodromas monacha TaxID=399045 RepID=A0A7R9BEE6_9CRUS|nr:unnamed protein product [Notodromas monacha]CAG0913857.1 unnamed protein product [Notodromas monacha]